MTDQLRKIAEAEARKIPQQPTITALPSLPIDFTNKVREGFVEGFIAGRTSVTREQIEQVIEREVDLALSSRLVLADAILALLNGDTDD